MAKFKNLLFALVLLVGLFAVKETPAASLEGNKVDAVGVADYKGEFAVVSGQDSLRVSYAVFGASISVDVFIYQLDSTRRYTSAPIDVSFFNRGTLYFQWTIDTSAGNTTTDTTKFIIWNYFNSDIKGRAIDTITCKGPTGGAAVTLSGTSTIADTVSAATNSNKWYFSVDLTSAGSVVKKNRRFTGRIFGTLNTGVNILDVKRALGLELEPKTKK